MERHMRLSRAAVVLVTIALIAAIAAAVWFASPDAPYVPSEDSGAALGTAAPAEDGTVASGHQPSGTGISDGSTAGSAITTIRNSGNGSYHLTSDIVVNSLTDCTFTGTLDGNGKTIYIRYDSDVTGEPNVDTEYNGIGALFGNLNGATIKNVKIVVETFRYVEGSSGTRNVGIIAGDSWGGVKIENVYVELRYSPTSNGRSYFLDSGAHEGSFTSRKNVELNFGAVLGKSGSSDADTDVTLKNVTVDNQTSGNYGFSAWVRHNDYCNYKVSMGHFVGWVTGELLMQNCTLRGGESAKMTIERGGSEGNTTNQSGAVIGRLDEQSGSTPSLTIAGLDMEMAINFGTYKVMNIDIGGNNGIIYGNDANNAYTVSVSDIFWNENSGDPGWYDGDDQNQITYNNLTKYDPNTIGVSFDNDQIVLSAMSQYIDKAELNSITFNNVSYPVWDKLIATGADTVGQWTQVATVDAPNSSSGGNVTYTTMEAGTFSLEGGETITGVSGNSYTAEREYDGKAPQSPSVVLSGNGGSFGEVWKAEGASANVGQYTMSFDKSVLTAADSVVATGSDGLTYIARNGIVYSPGSMEQIGQLNIVNNINVNITQASVTVKPSTPTTGLYTGNPLPELTATAVDSGGSPVEGSIEWDDPDATLISGTHSYNWTWTPASNNYQTKTGSIELEAFDRKIQSLSVQGDFKTAYTAYEPFDPRGVEVIAHYSDGSSEQLVNDEYEFTVMNGDKNRLIVKNETVTVSLKNGSGTSTTISITVSKLAVDVPIANQGLDYNGDVQTGVEASAEGYYSLTNYTGTNAADYTATAELKDKDNTEWSTGGTDNVTIPWSIAPMTLDGTVLAPGNLKYDGKEKEAAFDLTMGTLFGSDQVEVVYGVTDDRVNVTDDGFTATAKLPNDNYVWATDAPSASFVVAPMPVVIGKTADLSKTYDGNVVDPKSLFTVPQGVGGGELTLTVAVDGGKTILNAGSYTVTAVLADGQTNYTAQSAQARYEIAKVVLTGTLTFAGTATYDGTAKTATFILTSDNLVGEDRVGEVTYNGVDRINVTGQAIVASVALPSSGNYQWQDGVEPTASLTIVKATPVVDPTADVQGTLYTSDDLYEIALNLGEGDTPGTVSWDEGQRLTAGEQEYKWTFVPTDEVNYNGANGVIKLTAEQAQLESVTVDVKPNTAYTAFDAFDPTGMVVTAHYQNDATRGVAVSECELTVNEGEVDRLVVASTTVTVSYSDGDVTVSATFTIEVSPLEVAAPTAKSDLVYNGAQQTGVEEGEHYALSGDAAATNAGDYAATAALTDKANTVWVGGDSADVTIEWTIAQMTLDGAVSAAGSLEYDGTQKSARFEISEGELFGGDQVTITYSGEKDRINVTREEITATANLPSDNYAWADDTAPSATFTISPKAVEIESTQELAKTYDGEAVAPSSLFTEPNGVNNEGALQLAFVITVDGENRDEILNAGAYSVTASLAESVTNYTAVPVTITFTIAKATLTVTASAESDGLDTSDNLYAVPLSVKGVGVNGEEVSGTGVWAPGQSLSPGTKKYKFVFTPDQEFAVNYEVCEGECEIANVAQATLTGVFVEVKPSAYVAFDAFDRSSIVVEALYGEDRKSVTGYTLTFSIGAEDRLFAGTGITVTVTYTDGEVTQSTEFTIDVAKRAVAKPVVDPTVFDATGGTITLPIAESEYYNIYGNTAIEPGRYVATVELKDPANTMWKDGSTDVVSIAWTIREPVTSGEVIADILAMEKVTWQNAEEFLDIEARYDALDESEQTAEATAKLEVLRAQYDALRNAAFDDIEAAHEVTAKSLGKALAAAAAGLSAAAIALAIAKRRSI